MEKNTLEELETKDIIEIESTKGDSEFLPISNTDKNEPVIDSANVESSSPLDINSIVENESEEMKELFDQLKKSDFNAHKVMVDNMEKIFKNTYLSFCESNIDRIKFFISEGDSPSHISSEYNIKINGIDYHWNEDLFFKFESYKSSKLGDVELYLLDYREIHERVHKMDNSLFDDIKHSHKDFTYEDAKNSFNKSLEDIAERLKDIVYKEYTHNKSKYADIEAVDYFLDAEKSLLLINLLKEYNESNIDYSKLYSSTRMIRESIVKKINKDMKKSGHKLSDNDKDSIIDMIRITTELLRFSYYVKVKEIHNMEKIASILQSDDSNKMKHFKAYTENTIYKVLYKSLADRDGRYYISPYILSLYEEGNIEDMYIFKKFLDILEIAYQNNKTTANDEL